MDGADSLLLGVTVGFIGVVIEAWSSRNDDLTVRRLSVLRWLLITISVTAVSWAAWAITQQAWVSQAAAVLWAKMGEETGGWFIERARERREIAAQNRARQVVYGEVQNGTTANIGRETS